MTNGRHGALLRRLAALEGRAGHAGDCATCGGRHTGERIPLAVVDALLAGTEPWPCACADCCPALHTITAAALQGHGQRAAGEAARVPA